MIFQGIQKFFVDLKSRHMYLHFFQDGVTAYFNVDRRSMFHLFYEENR